MPLALRLEQVTFAYGHAPPVLRDVDLQVERGEFVAIAGPNGGGKTTLVRVVVGLEEPSSGSVELMVRKVGYLPQRTQAGIDAPVTVRELVTTGRASRTRLLGPLNAADRESVQKAIDRVGLSPQADRRLTTLSGGQQQRAFIAKALAADPELLVLDEPDDGSRRRGAGCIASLLQRLRSELGDDDPLRLARVRRRRALRRADRARPRRDRLRRASSALPGVWHHPSHVACLTSSSCGSPSCAGIVVGLLAPAVGFFLVQRRLSLVGDGIGHVAFAGVALGYLLDLPLVLTALVVSVAGGLSIEWIRSRRRAAGDQALALIFYTGIAGGVVLVSAAGALNVNLFQFLFGSILTVTRGDLAVIAALGASALAVIALLYRPLVAVVVDEEGARVAGLPVSALNSAHGRARQP